MLILETQPNPFVPLELSDNPEWTIFNDDLILQSGSLAQLAVLFTTGGGADAQTFTIGGQEFTTDSSQDYTSTSFDYSGTLQESVDNFMNMIRSSYVFKDWTVYQADHASGLRVFIHSASIGSHTWDNDVAALSPAVTLSENGGQDEIIKDEKLWYQVYHKNEQITDVQEVSFDENGRVRISAKKLARSILSIAYPDITLDTYKEDSSAITSIYLKFGTVTKSNCIDTFGQVYETAECLLVNAISQHESSTGFQNQTALYDYPNDWMTARSQEIYMNRNSFGFISIYLADTTSLTSNSFKLSIFYHNDSGVIASKEITMRGIDGVVMIPVGPANPIHKYAVNLSTKYTVDISALTSGGGYVGYSKQLTVNIQDSKCAAAEIYYLEDKGSWRTVVFEKIEQRNVEIIEQEYKERLSSDLVEVYETGGLNSEAIQSASVFLLQTEIITDSNRKVYEELLRSKYHYILTALDGEYKARKIIVDRGNYSIITRGGDKRMVIPFRFTTTHNLR